MDNMENITYEEFIQNILETRGRFGCGDEYHESHHVAPRCMGGDDNKNNLIDLFAREHFIAHKLLSGENPDNDKLIYAYWMMAHIGRAEISAEEYEEARKAFSEVMKERTCSEETRKKLSAINKGRVRTEEWIKKQRDSHKGKVHSEETRKKMGDARRGERNPNYGRRFSDEHRKKISEGHKGKEPWNKGKKASEEFCRKNSEAHKGLQIGANNPKARKVIRLSDNYIYDTMKECASDNNMTKKMIYSRCKKHKDFMYYDEWITQQNNYENELTNLSNKGE